MSQLDLLRRLTGRRREPSERAESRRLLGRIARGGARFERLVLTSNRRVMASVTDRGKTLRMSQRLAEAPDAVLEAVGRAFASRSAAARAVARTEIREYLAAQVDIQPGRTRRRTTRPAESDQAHIERLVREFDRVNLVHFRGRLPRVTLRLCGRMKRRNGHFSSDPLEIAVSRRLCEAGAAGEAERTLRHEMIHLWQWIEGKKPGHGPDFRRWAERLDIHPRATRPVRWAKSA